MTSQWPMPVRLSAALFGGVGMALLLALVGAWLVNLFETRERDSSPLAYEVDLLEGYTEADLAELLGQSRYQLPELADVPDDIAPTVIEPRQIRGFVMLELRVDAEGRPSDARVVAAAPEGIYEARAVDEALAATFTAGAPGLRSHVVRFSVPAGSVDDGQ
ncbi:MAG: hypothetical protein AAGA84_05720 [Pseudomonadota bacterium]